jgi:hypothetical protein
MLFHKSLVSFVAAIALASSVTASVTPERRQWSSCQASSGSSTCCTNTSPITSLSTAAQGLLALISPNLNLDLPIGLNCVLPGLLGWYCAPRTLYPIRWLTCRSNNNAVCCDGSQNESRCLSSLQPLALTDEPIQVASSTLALTASRCDSLFIQVVVQVAVGVSQGVKGGRIVECRA